jgi:hypothetical protein
MTIFELLVYALIIAGVVLFNYIMQRIAQKSRQERARREAQQRAEAAIANETGDYAWGKRPSPPVPATATEEAAQYEWSRRPQAAAVTPLEYSGAEPHRTGRALALEELQAREARSATEPQRQPWAHRRSVEARRLFATPEDLRRAVIAMTVLGPCRAIEGPDRRDQA